VARCTETFTEVWLVDFEFGSASGENPEPICLVAWEVRSGRRLQIWEDRLRGESEPPYSIGRDSLFVAYYASAELGCHLSLGWPLPVNILDLYVEFRNATNGRLLPCGNGLLGALAYFGLDALGVEDKEEMRKLALRGGPWTHGESAALLSYCETDVEALSRLLTEMEPLLDLSRALLRGRYMSAAARIEHVGVPIDVLALKQLRAHWLDIQEDLIGCIDAGYGVYEGRTFRQDRFAAWLVTRGIAWPRLESDALALDDDTFREMARQHPEVAPIRELRVSLSQMRLSDLAVGGDGRNRCLLSAFRSRTGRNQPSNSQFIFGPAVWLRGLIRPRPGWGLAYVDWEQQEFGIAAALSQDTRMMAAYATGDPYLAFAKQAGAVPESATKATHGSQREQFKACALAVQYGMASESLALRVGCPQAQAQVLLRQHHETYRDFWGWSDAALDCAMLRSRLHTVFGWTIHVGERVNPRSLRNYPMQANGAEMLRLACCLATERGIRVCAPIHDAILIEAPLGQIEEEVLNTRRAMAEASESVLGGFQLRSDVKMINHPDRYADERGIHMWDTVQRAIRNFSPATCSTHATMMVQ
jgi:DNA polymerase I